MITDHFPILGLRVRTPRLELRPPSLDDLSALADLAADGVHDPAVMPFLAPWTDEPPARRALSVIQYNLGVYSRWTPEKWHLPLAVVHEGRVVGIQDMTARDFAVTRQVSTGSWLGLEHQGKGIGTEMRAAVLHLAFAELGAREAASGAMEGNTPSERVSRRLGYRDDGTALFAIRGAPLRERRFRLTREDWASHRLDLSITVTGLEPCLPFFGAEDRSE
ncbi:GNAT family protein [Nocardiopsis sp. N85]|uniref:GNAT family N-acetyltransferase n=1 Tax=Nocardiopsis sp. N85 TaxID=3029400 RepID=UPI00237FBD96|nr:GNAT family protein [Nocardiopsis sp. N85]MDE3723925.1 GNAT family protein [Nocardiopsis sp. N85]